MTFMKIQMTQPKIMHQTDFDFLGIDSIGSFVVNAAESTSKRGGAWTCKGQGRQGEGQSRRKACSEGRGKREHTIGRDPIHAGTSGPLLHREPPTVAIRLGGTTVGQPLLGRCRAAGFMRKSSAINATYSNKYQNYLVYSIYMYIYIYYLVGGLEHEFYFFHILGISSSQLTNSYLSEG